MDSTEQDDQTEQDDRAEHDRAEQDQHDDQIEQDELDLDRFQAAIVALDDASLVRGLEQMDEKSLQDLSSQLGLPRATMHLGDALVPLVRRKLRTAHPERQLHVVSSLTDAANHETVEALGDRASDPSRDDLLEVLPTVLERHGPQLVTLMMASYAVSDAPCRSVMRDLLETDERFTVPEMTDEPEDDSVGTFGALPPSRQRDDDPELEAKRQQRRDAKAARKAESQRAREARAAGEAKRREAQHKAKKHRPAH